MSTESPLSSQSAGPPSALGGLFPPEVVVRERLGPGDPADLLAAEAADVVNAHPKRVGEFAAGRGCARAALQEFGIRDFALRRAIDRSPMWPAGIVGSITHTEGFCAAAVARQSRMLAIGIDSEGVGAPTLDIWTTICRPEEWTWLESLAPEDRPAAVTLVFAAKEAVYKCQYPLTSEWLDFHDLVVRVPTWGNPCGVFIANAVRRIEFSRHVELPITGRYIFHGRFVSAGVWTMPRLPA